MSWINEKLKYARIDPERSAILQKSKKVHDDVVTEMAANKMNVNEAMSNAQALIEQSIRAASVADHVNTLSESWLALETAVERKGEVLNEWLVLEMVGTSIGEINKWLDRMERSLKSGNLGSDLNSVALLLTKHEEMTGEIMAKENAIREIERTIRKGVQINKSQMDEIRGSYDGICKRYYPGINSIVLNGFIVEWYCCLH